MAATPAHPSDPGFAAFVLARLGFGARPGDVEAFQKLG